MRYLLTLALCLWASWAGAFPPGFLAAATSGAPAGGSPTYIIDEDFEGSGTPSGWTVGTATINYDYATSPAPLTGSHSLLIDGTSETVFSEISITVTGSEVWIKTKLNVLDFPGGAGMIELVPTASNASIFSDGSVGAGLTGGSWSPSGSGVLTLNTTAWMKIRYIIGTGTNTELYVYTSSDDSTYTLRASSTGGTSTTSPTYIRLISASGSKLIFDDFQVSEDAL